MPYWSIYFHLVWSTKAREPLLIGNVAVLAERSLRANCRDHKVVVHGLAIQPDHVHLALSIPPSIAVSTLVSRLKGSSSHLIRHAQGGSSPDFAWQAEYGAHSFGAKQLHDVVHYIEHQDERHAMNRLWDKLERWESDRQPASAGFVDVVRGLSPVNDAGEEPQA
ncbi:MAG: IS200/IS605 family transposase [Thermomicrobiales bacterium]|nr:IS200/IS605 family transposase [Thermomicrobiales bacterium]